jgi:hypothetical protein
MPLYWDDQIKVEILSYELHHIDTQIWDGSCRGNVPRVPWAAGYDPKFWIQSVPSSDKRLWNHTPHIRKWPHHSRLKRGP